MSRQGASLAQRLFLQTTPVPQYSPAAAEAMANKIKFVGGQNGSLLKAGKMFSMSALHAAPVAPAAAGALVAAAAPAAEQKASLLRKALKAVAIAAAGLAIMAVPALADAPMDYQWMFQDSATSTMQAMVDLHHDIMFFLITIVTVTLYMFGQILTKFHYSRVLKPEKLTHHTTMEVIWTIIPTAIVLMIAVPSLTLIYSLDQHTERPGLTVKIIGRQWYWSYEMHDHLQHKLLDADKLVDLAARSLDK
ncbi:MAG: hypothetical protein WDW38_000747 [Sanguina aurantia]